MRDPSPVGFCPVVLSRAPEQLCSQLWSRLRFIERQELRNLLEQAANCQGQPWLATLTPSLECAGGPLLQTLVGHTDTVNAVAVTPDGQRVISASSDKTLKIWALSTGQLQHTLEGHKGPVSAVAVTPDSRFAISGSTDGTIVIWDISSGSFVRELTGHPLAIRDVAVPLKGGRAISICDKELQVWQIPSGHLLHKFDIAAKYREENCRAEHALLAINSNGKRALTAISFSSLINGSPINSIIEFFDTDVGKLLFSQQAHPCRVNGIAISADGRWGVTAPQSGPYWLSDAYIKVWDLDEGTIKWKLPNGGTRAIALTPDARFLVSSEGIDKWGRRLNSPLMGYPNRISSDVSWRTLDEG